MKMPLFDESAIVNNCLTHEELTRYKECYKELHGDDLPEPDEECKELCDDLLRENRAYPDLGLHFVKTGDAKNHHTQEQHVVNHTPVSMPTQQSPVYISTPRACTVGLRTRCTRLSFYGMYRYMRTAVGSSTTA